MAEKIELVCFDLGGVLIRLVTGWEQAVQVAGVHVPPRDQMLSGWERHHELVMQLEVGQINWDTYARALPECFPGFPCENIHRAFDAWLLGLYPGVKEMIADIRRAGRKTAILSNTNERHWSALDTPEYAPLKDVDYLLASHQIRCRKPEEIAYRHVERRTGVSGSRILFFDDRAENIAAARAAGWHAEQIDPTRDGVPQIRQHLARYGVIANGSAKH